MTTAQAAIAGDEAGDLIVRREGAAGVIRLNRPKAINAVTLEMFRDIDRALDQFEADPAVGLILLEGAGERGLCAGGDIRGLYESARAGGDLGRSVDVLERHRGHARAPAAEVAGNQLDAVRQQQGEPITGEAGIDK